MHALSATNVTGTVAVANGGTGATTGVDALTNLGHLRASSVSDQTVTDSTTLVSSTELTVTVVNTGIYAVRAVLMMTASDTVAGLKVALAGTATVSALKAQIRIEDDSAFASLGRGRVTALGSAVSGTGVTGNLYVLIDGVLTASANGTILVQFALATDPAFSQNCVLQAGSFLELTRVA